MRRVAEICILKQNHLRSTEYSKSCCLKESAWLWCRFITGFSIIISQSGRKCIINQAENAVTHHWPLHQRQVLMISSNVCRETWEPFSTALQHIHCQQTRKHWRQDQAKPALISDTHTEWILSHFWNNWWLEALQAFYRAAVPSTKRQFQTVQVSIVLKSLTCVGAETLSKRKLHQNISRAVKLINRIQNKRLCTYTCIYYRNINIFMCTHVNI